MWNAGVQHAPAWQSCASLPFLRQHCCLQGQSVRSALPTHRLAQDLKHEVSPVSVHEQNHRLGVSRRPEVGLQRQAILVLHHTVLASRTQELLRWHLHR